MELIYIDDACDYNHNFVENVCRTAFIAFWILFTQHI